MSSVRFDEARDYAFADQLLALRKRAGLTQRDLGALLQVSSQAIRAWEGGLSYPGTDHLKQLIALYLERGTLMAGREEAEAEALWATVRAKAARRLEPFDPVWFAALRSAAADADPATPPPSPAAATPPLRHDWGDAPAAPVVQGRAEELATLARWVTKEHCRLVEVVGVGGIGKTTVAARLAYELAPTFAVVYWRSLRNALPVEEWLAGALAALSAGQAVTPEGFAARLVLLMEYLRAQRALLVLDNLETILEPGAAEVRYRPGYEGYGAVLARLAESGHQSCLVLTSREKLLREDEGAVRALRLEGLGVDAGRMLLAHRGLAGDGVSCRALVERYGGNPLALSIVEETITVVFGGDTAAFLAQDVAVFGGIRQLLEEQVGRLSALEQTILAWLAVEREPVGFATLVADLGPGHGRGEAVEAVEALLRRSLLEWGTGGTFTLQPVVLEYATARLVEAVAREILAGEPALLVSQALLKATAKDYVRRSQERLIAQPLQERLRGSLGSAVAVERQLLALLGRWRGQPAAEQGYGPGNVVNLLRLLRGDFRGLDFSRLSIRHAYLQEVEAQGASLAGTHLAEAVLAEAFKYATALALSADAAYLAVGTFAGEVCLWKAADRTPLLALQVQTAGIYSVALSGDGRLLASGGIDGTVRLSDFPSARLPVTLRGHTGAVWSVALSGDGRLLASGSQDGTVRLWETGTGQLTSMLQGHSEGVYCVALSGDGRLLASGGQDGTVRLWETGTGRLTSMLQGHTGAVWSVALSEDGRLVASGGIDGTVRLWETGTGRLTGTLQGHTGAVWGLALSGDGRLLASGSQDGTVRLWEAGTGRLVATLQEYAGGVRGVALSGDGGMLASCSQDGRVKLWEAGSERLVATLQGYAGWVRGIALSGDGALLASSSQDEMVKLWQTASGQLLATLQEQSAAVWAVALSGDGALLASGSQDGTVKLWEVSAGRLLATLQGHPAAIYCVALSRDGRVVASGSFDGTARLWETASGRLLATLQGHTAGIHSVALSGDGRLLASGSFDQTVRLWETASGRLLATLEGHAGGVYSVALSADGRLLASGGQDGTVRLWDAGSGRPLATLQGHTSAVWGVALSGDGRLAASGSWDGTVRLWEAGSGRLLATLQGHANDVWCVALSADGRLVASGSQDGTVKLWEVTSGACLRTLRGNRRYEGLDITALTGVTEAQKATLLALGAIEQPPAQHTQFMLDVPSASPEADTMTHSSAHAGRRSHA